MSTLVRKASEFLDKANLEAQELKARLRQVQPQPVDPVVMQELRREMFESTPDRIRRTVLEMNLDPRNMERMRHAIAILAERLESVMSMGRSRTSTTGELHTKILQLEAERHALVESLRIVSSKGEYDPFEDKSEELDQDHQEGQSGV